ncbi:hypothetical protein ACSMXN_17245 [Jatrophihabitans sp. DSM 45814]
MSTTRAGAASVPVAAYAPVDSEGTERRGGPWTRRLSAVPDATIVIFLCAVVAVGPLATFGQFRKLPVLCLFVAALFVGRRLLPEPMTAERRSARWSAVAVIVAIAFVLVNLGYTSEYYIVVRDPAVYTLRAIWMVHHASPNIPNGDAVTGAQDVSGAYVDTSGFFQVGNHWEPQGSSLVPGLFATGGWFAGESGVLAANLAVGGVALMSVYAFGRRLLGPAWALVPMIAMATSLPMIAFSRSSYTEPTALILGIGGLVLLRAALKSPSPLRSSAAGVALGATFLSRTDGLIFLLGVIFALGLVAALARSASRRRELHQCLLWVLFGASVSVGLAFIDLARNSATYEMTSWGQIRDLTALTIVVALLAVGSRFLPGLEGLRARLGGSSSKWVSWTAVVVLLGFVAMALRPLFYERHVAASAAIATRQAANHLAVDGTRTYDENTISWLAWYFSWPVVVLGAIGVSLLLVQGWRRRDVWLTAVLSVQGAASLLYLNRSLITPDQIWAMRRFLPIVIPLGLVAATGALRIFGRRFPRLWPMALIAGLLVATAPLLFLRPVVSTTQYAGARAFVDSVCARVGDDHVVIADNTDGGRIFLPALRIKCGVQAVLLSESTPQTLLAVRSNWTDNRPITVVSFVETAVPWTTPQQNPVLAGAFPVWDEPLTSRPKKTIIRTMSVYLGDLQPDGRVAPRS